MLEAVPFSSFPRQMEVIAREWVPGRAMVVAWRMSNTAHDVRDFERQQARTLPFESVAILRCRPSVPTPILIR